MTVIAYLDTGAGGQSGLAVLLIVLGIGVVWIGVSVLIAKWAERKGQSFAGFLLLGILVSPVIAAIAALIAGDRPRSPAVSTPPAADHLDQLKKLSELRESGTLSAEEFEAEKTRIMQASG